MSEELARARSLAEQGELKAALKQLERARRAALAAGDEETLGELLDLAASIQARTSGKENRDAARIASALRQNLRFVSRRKALAEGREWIDPIAGPQPVPEHPTPKRRVASRRANLAGVIAVAAGATLIALGVVVWRVPQRIFHRYVTCSLTVEGEPAWSPDGRRIAFGRSGDIVVADVRTGRIHRLTEGHCAGDSAPAWSPDGTRLAFSDENGNISIVRSDGTGRRRLVADGDSPSWSPDGQWIVYGVSTGLVDVSSHLYVVHPDGTGKRRVDTADTFAQNPSWAPDGHEIAFEGNKSGIYLARFPSGGNIPLDDTAYCEYPAWAPTGGRIATTCGDIVVLGLPDLDETDTHVSSDDRPAWSPDGKQLAFYDDATKRLEVIAADGSGRRIVAVVS